MLKIYIDRQKIAENEPAIVIQSPDGAVEFCSLVSAGGFVIKQDFSRKVKPVVWIEYNGGTLPVVSTKKPANAVVVENPPRVKRTVK
jgi:hypothetical protein